MSDRVKHARASLERDGVADLDREWALGVIEAADKLVRYLEACDVTGVVNRATNPANAANVWGYMD